MNSSIRRLLTRCVKPAPVATARRARLGVLQLEDRTTPATFTVTNTNDAGGGSFRQAITDANTATTADNIVFDAATFGTTAKTIDLLTVLPQITSAGAALTITGPGAALLTIQRSTSAAATFRVFDSLSPTLTMTGFTVAGGNIAADGAGLQASGNVTLDAMVFSGNQATGANDGGAMRMNSGASLFMKNSTLTGNAARNGPGIYFFNGGSLVVEGSTISGNTSSATTSGYGGGGFYFFGVATGAPPAGFTASTLVVRNSTIANNTTGGSGGGIALRTFTGTLLVQSSTITGNSSSLTTAGYGGGGIGRISGTHTITVENSVVSGNTNANGPDIISSGTVNVNFSAIGSTTGFTLTGANNVATGANLKLGTLGNFGGPTQTFHPQAGSPLLNVGSNALVPGVLTSDQRGGSLVRTFGGTVDIGAVETQPTNVAVNQAAGQADPTNIASVKYTVVFNQPVTGFDAADVQFTGSTAGAGLVAAVAGASPGQTYTVTVTGMTTSGDVVVTVPAGAAVDGNGTATLASTSTDNKVAYDVTPPTVTINQAGSQGDPTNATPILFTVVFTEAVTGFTGSDINFGGSSVGGTLVAAVSGSGANYTVSVTGMAGVGNVVVNIPAAAVTDLAGNLSFASTSTDNSVTFDGVAPTVTINQAGGQADPTNALATAGKISFTVVFSESVSGFDGSDISFAGSTVGGTPVATVTGTGANYTVQVSGMAGVGDVVVSIPASKANDLAGNPNVASTSTDNKVTFDLVAPTVTINQAAGQADPTNAVATGGKISFTVVFSESVTGFAANDISFAGSSVGGTLVPTVTGTGANYTVQVAGMAGVGDLVVSILAGAAADASTNNSVASTSSDNKVTFDAVAPTVTIDQASTQPDPSNSPTLNFTVEFSEPVTGFTGADIDLSAGTALPTTAMVSQTGPMTYNVAVSGMTKAGTVIASVLAGSLTDLAGNANPASTSIDNTITSDAIQPTVTINQAAGQADPTTTGPVLFTVVFDEAVSGFDATDIDLSASTVGGALVATVTGSGPTYTVSVSGMLGAGDVIATIPVGGLGGDITDLAGNPSKASTSTDNVVNFDTVAPTVTVNRTATQADPTNVASVEFDVVFSESVTGFDKFDVDLSASTAGGTLVATVTGSGSAYVVTVTGMVTTGTIIIAVPADAAIDQVGLGNSVSSAIDDEVIYDIIAPQTFILTGPPAFWNSDTAVFTFTGEDNVSPPEELTFVYSLDGGAFVATVSPLTLAGLADGTHTIEVVATDPAGNPDGTPAVLTFVVDTINPGLSLTSTAPEPTNTQPIPVLATFTEFVDTFDATDLVATNATVSNFAPVVGSGGTRYTFELIPTGQGAVTVEVAAGAAPDRATNPNALATLTRTFDTVRPTLTLSSTNPNPTNTSPIVVSAVFTELVTSFTSGDLVVVNATVANFQAISGGTNYSFELIPTGQGTVSVSVPAGAAPDPATNPNFAASLSRVFDTVRPTVTINQAAAQADPTNASPILFTVVFSEPVTGFGPDDVFLSGTAGATIAQVTGSGTTYTVAVSGMGQFGTVTATVGGAAAQDAALNLTLPSTSTDNTVLFDSIVPIVTITPAAGQRDPATVGPVLFTVTFSKPVTGFTAADLNLSKSLAGGSLSATVAAAGATFQFLGATYASAYTVAVSGMTTPGDVVLDFAAGAATDQAGSSSLAPSGGDPVITYAGEVFAVGAGNGGGPRVDVFNGTGRLLYTFFAYDPSFRGGVHVAVGDITGDGIPDIVVGAGFGGSPHVKVFDGRTQAEVASFFAYDDSARGGVFVAVADVTGDGRVDIITGAGPGGGPHVGVFDGRTLGNVLNFFAFPDTLRGGVSVAAGDLNGDGRADIVTGNGLTGEVQVYDSRNLASIRRIAPFFQPATTQLPLGVNMAVGDFTGDGIVDLAIGAGPGGGPLVEIYDNRTGVLLKKSDVFAFDESFRGGVTLAARDFNGDAIMELLVGSGDNGDVKVIDARSLTELSLLDPFGPTYSGSVFVG